MMMPLSPSAWKVGPHLQDKDHLSSLSLPRQCKKFLLPQFLIPLVVLIVIQYIDSTPYAALYILCLL